jgi:predicted DNA-binding transcriptional regulator AlpA
MIASNLSKGAIMLSTRALAATKHGMSRSRPYRIWRGFRQRCDSPSERHARWYTGISYDPKWKTFKGFWEDMKEGYADHLTLDRIDSSKDYCKENCRWATMKEQSRNRKDTIFIPYNGEMLCVTDVAKKVGMNRSLLYKRLENNCPLDKLFRPSRKAPKEMRIA